MGLHRFQLVDLAVTVEGGEVIAKGFRCLKAREVVDETGFV